MRLRGRRHFSPSRDALPGLGLSGGLDRNEDWLDQLEGRLAWILGSSRTGSTWLLRMLIHPWELSGQAPGVAAGEGGVRRGPPIVPINETYLPSHLTPIRENFEPRRMPSPDQLLLNSVKRAKPSYFLSRAYEATWRPEFRRLILARLGAQADDAMRKLGLGEAPTVVVKEPNGSHGAQLLMSLLPSSRLIFLIRDGRDVVDSQLALRLHEGSWQRRHPEQSPVKGAAQRLRFVRAKARRWVLLMTAVQAAYEAHPDELRYRLRYEDLLSDTPGELRGALDWLGRPRSMQAVEETTRAHSFENIRADRKGPGEPVRAARSGLWRQNLLEAEKEAIAAIAGDKLRELGYEG